MEENVYCEVPKAKEIVGEPNDTEGTPACLPIQARDVDTSDAGEVGRAPATDTKPGERGSFYELLAGVRRQIDYAYLTRDRVNVGIVADICAAITEVYLLSDKTVLCIDGEDVPVTVVRDVYMLLRCDHIIYVINEYRKVCAVIRRKKVYIRTLLYNSVFEMSLAEENEETNAR